MSLVDQVTAYYAARAPIYDETAGYADAEAERLRAPIKARYRELFRDRSILEIACGTGFWTAVIGEVAKSVHAIDINPALVRIATERCMHLPTVTVAVADAYTLENVPTGFDAAVGVWWWSHVPRERLAGFLSLLHSKLAGGALVLFVDQLPYGGAPRRQDAQGNTLERRSLPDGRSFEIVKNFPTAEEVVSILKDKGKNVRFTVREGEKSWSVTYTTKTP